MGLFDQGWGCRCDQCHEQADGTVGGRTKAAMKQVARSRGWMSVRGKYWFCCASCIGSWWAKRSNDPAFSDLEKDVIKELSR